jgi:GxxExxY protein
MDHNAITGAIINVAIDVHRSLGPGLLESVYEAEFAHELRKRGLQVETQVPIPVVWDGVQLDLGFRADLVVNRAVVTEIKSVELINPVHKKQLQSYLKLMDVRVGLLINFNVEVLKSGIVRVVNRFAE